MRNKVILICIDGMRPDGFEKCGNPYTEELKKICSYTYNAKTVFPPETLQAHMSMIRSVTPQEHGVLTYKYVRPTCKAYGIFERIKNAKLKGGSAMFYGWEPLRDIARPNSLSYSTFIKIGSMGGENVDILLTDEADRAISKRMELGNPFDFVFLYLPETDEEGHRSGWMGERYLEKISVAVDCVKRMIEKYGDEYSVILMTDHGGHELNHGQDVPEDMIIPLFFYGDAFEAGKVIDGVSIMDIAPTITKILGIDPDEYWRGSSIV